MDGVAREVVRGRVVRGVLEVRMVARIAVQRESLRQTQIPERINCYINCIYTTSFSVSRNDLFLYFFVETFHLFVGYY